MALAQDPAGVIAARISRACPPPFARPAAQKPVREVLEGVSDKYRAVVILHDIEERSIPEIARIVGAGELTVRSRLRDGRKQLAKLLRAHDKSEWMEA